MIATASLFGLDTDIAVSVTESTSLARALRHTRTVAQRLDQTINRSCASAEITALDLADGSPVLVSSLLDQLIIEALFYDDLTDGATRAVRGPSTGSPIPPWHRVRIGGAATTVPTGLRLELMDIGRAFLADRAAQELAQELGCGALVRVGAVAATAGPAPVGGWDISLGGAHTSLPKNRAAAVVVADEEDPGDGHKDERPHTVTVVADSAAMAQAAALRAVVDPAGAASWLHTHAATAHLSDDRADSPGGRPLPLGQSVAA
jgi:thiamine biosynthesis lipoprotein ApbE